MIIPIIICLISNLIVLPASAESVDPGSLVYYSLSDFQNECNYDSSKFYFYVTYKRSESVNYTYSGYIQVDESKIKSIDCVNGTYYIEFTENVSLYSYTNTHSTPGKFKFSSGYYFSVYSIIFEPGSRCYFFDSTGKLTYPGGGSECILYDVQTNMFNADPSMPDVTVEFTPDLSGKVDRTVTNSNGTKSSLQDLQMIVHNNSSFAVQYNMKIFLANPLSVRTYDTIFEDDDTFVPGATYNPDATEPPTKLSPSQVVSNQKDWLNTHYDNDPVFIYYSNTQVYEGLISPESRIPDGNHPMLYNKASEWHKVDANSDDVVTIPFSMINLKENVDYIVYVECYRLDLDYVCNIVRPSDCPTAHVDVDTYCRPYYNTFSFTNYSDVVYNPNKTSGDILPFDGSSGIAQCWGYDYNYDAKTDPITGEQQIGHYDYYNNASSWVNNGEYSNVSGGLYPGSSSGFGDVSVTSFSGMFSNVFGFVSMFMNYLPAQIMAIFIFGFSCIVVIAIIKAVR